MTKYFAGQFAGQFNRSRITTSDVTTSGRFDPTYVSSGVGLAGGVDAYIESAEFSATGTVWIVFDFYKGNGAESGSGQHLVCRNGTTNVFRLAWASGSIATQPQYWNGSAWVDTGSSVNLARSSLHRIAIRITLNTSFEMWLNGMPVSSGSGWTGGPTTMTLWRGYNYSTTDNSTVFSQLLIADYDIRDDHLMASEIDGDSSANTGAASGGYADVNGTGIDDSTAISITGSGNKQGQTHAGITVPVGMEIAAMVITARGRVDGVISDGILGVRAGGSNYSSAGMNFNSGYETRQRIIETDPSTTAKFTQSGFNAAEPFLEAA